jgi:hypothetical protein
MPVPRRPRKQQAADTLAGLHRELRRDLECGYGFFQEYETKEEMAAAWDAVGKELLREWIAENPATRPYAWWLFDHGKERPVINDSGEEYLARERREARFGFLHTSIWGRGGYFQQEPLDYLIEHDLLEPGELERYHALRLQRDAEFRAAHCTWRARHEPNMPRKQGDIDD